MSDDREIDLTNVLEFPKLNDAEKEAAELATQKFDAEQQAINISLTQAEMDKPTAHNPFSPQGNPFQKPDDTYTTPLDIDTDTTP